MSDSPRIDNDILALAPWLSNVRRSLHRIPEAGDAEYETQKEIMRVLGELGIPFTPMGTGVVALLEGEKPGPVVAVRADIDALPLNEPDDRSYASTHPGFMHACGHDAHMTVALGTAKYFSDHRHNLTGSVKFLFQPAEETSGGAAKMIQAGCLENPKVDYVIGLHVMPDVPVGKVEVKKGALNGASDYLVVTVRGKSAHAAYPDTGVDAVMIAAKTADALHTVVSRYVSPLKEAVLTVGTIQGGIRNNIVADEVRMTGTIRTADPAIRSLVADRVRQIVRHIPEAFGGSGEVEIRAGYPALINHDKIVDVIAREAAALLGSEAVLWKEKPSMGVEDFSYFLEHRPGSFYHLGCGNPAKGITAPLHARTFDIDESCLPIGVAVHVATILELGRKLP